MAIERLPPSPLPEAIAESLPRVFALSRFVAEKIVRHPEWLTWRGLLEERRAFKEALGSAIGSAPDFEGLCRTLRDLRNREMVRIAWRDLAGWATLSETLRDLTQLAELLIDGALSWLFRHLSNRYGVPRRSDGTPQNLVVIGMGKLGGGELNFSSDVDLIFAYEQEGALKSLSFQEFYFKLAQAVIQALHRRTPDGFVYRVDTRLRPFGESGPLVLNFDAMEEYYQSFGRDWERYAWIKARPIAGDLEAGWRLIERLQPFVYRRYLDYSAFEALRELKRRIMAEVRRKELFDDIKRGPGGIRELEFMVQLFQLIYGGREPKLKTPSFYGALQALAELGHLERREAMEITDQYDFMRLVEHRLQEERDEQTQRLPRDEVGRLRLAFGLGYRDWPSFEEALERRRRWVQSRFDRLLAVPEVGGDDLLEGELPEEVARQKLFELGYRHPGEALSSLKAFCRSRRYRLIGPQGEKALRLFLPELLRLVARREEPEKLLRRLLFLLETLAGRSVYYLLLAEQPQALRHLVELARSPFIVEILGQAPLLLDELIDPRTLYALPDREALQRELSERLAMIPLSDEEGLFEQLRLFKKAHLLRIAAAALAGSLNTHQVQQHLTQLAEVVLEGALRAAWRSVTERYGSPPGVDREEVRHFAVIGYGKLGSRELNYTSDLDLVFLYREDRNGTTSGSRPIPTQQFYLNLARRLIVLLTTQTALGKVYEIDTQLRPSGRAGLLVSSFEAYVRYQRKEAWTWEHQALIRARPVAGDRSFKEPFSELRTEIMIRERDPKRLAREFSEMRAKMVAHLDRSQKGLFDLKQGRGGLVDLQFVVELETLLNARRAPDRFREGGLFPLIEALVAVSALTPEEGEAAREVALSYHAMLQRLALEGKPQLVPVKQVERERAVVQRLWRDHIDRYLA